MMPSLPDIAPGWWFLSSPYSKYRGGIDVAYHKARNATIDLVTSGVVVYSPIVHSHPLAMYGGIDPLAHDFWMRQSLAMLDTAGGLILLTLDGWQESVGMRAERERFAATGRPIVEWEGV